MSLSVSSTLYTKFLLAVNRSHTPWYGSPPAKHRWESQRHPRGRSKSSPRRECSPGFQLFPQRSEVISPGEFIGNLRGPTPPPMPPPPGNKALLGKTAINTVVVLGNLKNSKVLPQIRFRQTQGHGKDRVCQWILNTQSCCPRSHQPKKKQLKQNPKECVDGRNPKQPPFGCTKPVVNNGISTTNFNWWVYRISEPSTKSAKILWKRSKSWRNNVWKNLLKWSSDPWRFWQNMGIQNPSGIAVWNYTTHHTEIYVSGTSKSWLNHFFGKCTGIKRIKDYIGEYYW